MWNFPAMAPTDLKSDRRSSQKEIRCFGSSSMYIYIYMCMWVYVYIYIYIHTSLSLSLPTYLSIINTYIYISMCLFEGEKEYEIVEKHSLKPPMIHDLRSQPWRPRVIHTGNTGCTMQWTQMSALSWPDFWPDFSHEMEMAFRWKLSLKPIYWKKGTTKKTIWLLVVSTFNPSEKY